MNAEEQAVLNQVASQRNQFLDALANTAASLAIKTQECEALKAEIAKLTPPAPVDATVQ